MQRRVKGRPLLLEQVAQVSRTPPPPYPNTYTSHVMSLLHTPNGEVPTAT